MSILLKLIFFLNLHNSLQAVKAVLLYLVHCVTNGHFRNMIFIRSSIRSGKHMGSKMKLPNGKHMGSKMGRMMGFQTEVPM